MAGDQDDIGSAGKSVALEHRDTSEDGRRYSPSIARNKDIIAEVFERLMPLRGHVLEIASGTGEHGADMTERFADLHWVYTDVDEISIASQAAWARAAGTGSRLTGPFRLDASKPDWGEAEQVGPYDGVFCANMIHIAPFAAAEGLLAGAGRVLKPGGRLFLYGPFARNGAIAESNARFSDDLKRRDADWGVRDLDRDIIPLAKRAGLRLVETVEMPANNLSVIFERA